MIVLVIACIIGLVFDLAIGDPPKMPHPVRWIGKLYNRKPNYGIKGQCAKLVAW